VVRSGLRALLLADPDLEVVGEAGDGTEVLRLAESLQPDVVLLDITMPPEDGIKTGKRLKETNPELFVLFLTMHEDESMMHEALRAGASGYVVKRAEESEIIQAIHVAYRGDIYVHPAMTRALLQQPVTTQHRRGFQPEQLTRRELDVLRLLRSDLSGPDIARELTVSLNTLRTHTKRIYVKLGVNSRREAVTRATELGL